MCTVHWNYTHACSGPGRLWSRDLPVGVGRGLFRVLLLCDVLLCLYREVARWPGPLGRLSSDGWSHRCFLKRQILKI